MEIYERIKLLRKNELKNTQEEFAEKINISRSNLGNIEIGKIGITDRVIKDICSAFNVNAEWLRTGEGEILNSSEDDALASIAAKYGSDELDKRIIEVFLTLPPEQRKVFSAFAKELAGNLIADDKKADK